MLVKLKSFPKREWRKTEFENHQLVPNFIPSKEPGKSLLTWIFFIFFCPCTNLSKSNPQPSLPSKNPSEIPLHPGTRGIPERPSTAIHTPNAGTRHQQDLHGLEIFRWLGFPYVGEGIPGCARIPTPPKMNDFVPWKGTTLKRELHLPTIHFNGTG